MNSESETWEAVQILFHSLDYRFKANGFERLPEIV